MTNGSSTLLNSARMARIRILMYKLMPKAVVFYENRNSVITFNLRLKFSLRPIRRQRIKYVVRGCYPLQWWIRRTSSYLFRMARQMKIEELRRAQIDDGR